VWWVWGRRKIINKCRIHRTSISFPFFINNESISHWLKILFLSRNIYFIYLLIFRTRRLSKKIRDARGRQNNQLPTPKPPLCIVVFSPLGNPKPAKWDLEIYDESGNGEYVYKFSPCLGTEGWSAGGICFIWAKRERKRERDETLPIMIIAKGCATVRPAMLFFLFLWLFLFLASLLAALWAHWETSERRVVYWNGPSIHWKDLPKNVERK